MDVDYGLDLTQSQTLVMNTKIIQSLSILSMSSIELENEIKKQEEENPLIEIEFKNSDKEIDWLKYIENTQKFTYTDKNEIAFNVKDECNFENMIKENQNLYDYLKNQISYLKISKRERQICEYIIDSLDEDGYLNKQDEKNIFNNLKIDENEYNICLNYIQSLDPSGVGATNLSECLLIQLKNLGINDKILNQIIKEDLDNIGSKKIKDICKKYKIGQNKCIYYMNIIKSLEPRPGKIYQSDDIQYIKPDVIVKKIDDEFIVITSQMDNLSININDFYKNILQKSDYDDETKQFVNTKLNSALSLIKNIENRKSTILKIAEQIVKRQRDFFENGINYIKPMTMQEIANEIQLHQSTISRGVNGKYMLTPYGLFEFRYFFSNELEDMSSIKIKNLIKEIIKNESKIKPLSDEKIKIILSEKGIELARRTIAKYREDMKILPSSKRKQIIT